MLRGLVVTLYSLVARGICNDQTSISINYYMTKCSVLRFPLFVATLRNVTLKLKKVQLKLKQSLYKPGQALRAEAPRILANRHMKVARLSALRTGRLYPRRKYLCYSFPLEAEWTPSP